LISHAFWNLKAKAKSKTELKRLFTFLEKLSSHDLPSIGGQVGRGMINPNILGF